MLSLVILSLMLGLKHRRWAAGHGFFAFCRMNPSVCWKAKSQPGGGDEVVHGGTACASPWNKGPCNGCARIWGGGRAIITFLQQ